MTTDDTLSVWAIGYDSEWNFIGEINSDWTTTGTLDLQTATGVSSFIFSPLTTGSGIVFANDLSGHTDVTGLITVNVGVLSYILIRDAPSGLGNVIERYKLL